MRNRTSAAGRSARVGIPESWRFSHPTNSLCAVWDKLVEMGKLHYAGGGLYGLAKDAASDHCSVSVSSLRSFSVAFTCLLNACNWVSMAPTAHSM